MISKEPTIRSEYKFNGFVFDLRVDTIRTKKGGESTREIIEHNGGVGIIPIDDEKNVYMVRQYRRGADEVLLEIPAGKLEKGEEPYSCAVRELEEETGFKASKITYLGFFYVSPAYDTEKIHIYLAQGLTPGAMHLDEEEELEVEKHSFASLLSDVHNGKITDGKTVIGLMLAEKIL